MKRNEWHDVSFLLIVGMGLILLSSISLIALGQRLGQPAPDFVLPDRSGQMISLRELRGRVILLDFWATWCRPCRRTMPHVQKWHEQYKDRGLKVIGVNIEGPLPRVFRYLDAGKYAFTVVFDQGNWRSQIVQLYGVHSIPYTFLIDRRGIIRYRGHPLRLPERLLQAVLRERGR